MGSLTWKETLLYGAVAAMLAMLGYAGTSLILDASTINPPLVRLLSQAGDSAHYEVTWTAPAVDSISQLPIARYELQVLRDSGGTGILMVRQPVNAPQVIDTFALALPALGDSVGPLRAKVAAIDTDGHQSAWSPNSATWWLHRAAVNPNPPGVPTVRELGGFLKIAPKVATLQPGESMIFCASTDPNIPAAWDPMCGKVVTDSEFALFRRRVGF